MGIEAAHIDIKHGMDGLTLAIEYAVEAQNDLNPKAFSLFKEKASLQERVNSRIGQIKASLAELQTEITGLNELFGEGEGIGGQLTEASKDSFGSISLAEEKAGNAENYLRRAGLPPETVNDLTLPTQTNAALAKNRVEALIRIGEHWSSRFLASKEEATGLAEIVSSLDERLDDLSGRLVAINDAPDNQEQVVEGEPLATVRAVSDTRESALLGQRDLIRTLERMRANGN